MDLENTSQTEEQATEVPGQEGQEQTAEAAQVIELDSVPKFKFAGKEWTPKDFQGAYMMQADYTRKTQALAEERKYYENLNADLDAVKQNPSLAEQFKAVYPEKFHQFLGYVAPAAPAAEKKESTPGIDPQFMERFSRVEKELHDRKVQAAEAELDALSTKFSKQYPLADEEIVLARAQALVDRGEKLTQTVWDGLWKGSHEKNQKVFEQRYSAQVKEQKTANSKGKDASAGGGMPGQAPKTPRTIKEASELALRELENS